MSMQFFVTKLAGIGSKSDNFYRAIITRQCPSPSVTEVKLCNSVLVSEGLVAPGHELEGKEEWIIKILFMKEKMNAAVGVTLGVVKELKFRAILIEGLP